MRYEEWQVDDSKHYTMGKFERNVFLVCFDHFELEMERCWLALFLFLQTPPIRREGCFGLVVLRFLVVLLLSGIMAGMCGGKQAHISTGK